MPSASYVYEASPPAAYSSSAAAITSQVDSMVEQRAELFSTIVQYASNVLNTLDQVLIQDFAFLQLQVDHILGINPTPQNQATSTSVAATQSSDSGMGRGNSSGAGSGSGTLTATHNTPNQSQNHATQQSGSGSGSGSSATTTAHGNASQQGSIKVHPMTSGTGTGSGSGTAGSGTGSVGSGTGSGEATVSGNVWLDNDGDGSLDHGELGYAGITVDLFDATGDNEVQSTTTDSNGNYSFQPLLVGPRPEPYFVHVELQQAGYYATYPGFNQINNNGNSLPFGLAKGGWRFIEAGLLTMTVSTTKDDPGGPIQNQQTLRDAIKTGNNGGGPLHLNTIQFYDRQAKQQLSGTISLQAALDPIERSYDILGPGASTLTVQGGGANNPFRIFYLNAGVTSTISGLKITGGYVSGQNGGGIYNAGALTLKSDIVRNNTAAANVPNAGGSGGGIYNSSDGSLTLYYTQVDDNTAASAGGGVANSGTFKTSADVEDSIFLNSAEVGGGIANVGAVATAKILSPTTIFSNKASDRGGGVFISGGSATISGSRSGGTNKQINLNEAPSGGGVYVVSGTLTLNNLNIMTNEATTGDGGGLFLAGASTTNFDFVMVSDNTAPAGKVAGVAYQQNATLNPQPLGNKLTDKDDPNGKPVQV